MLIRPGFSVTVQQLIISPQVALPVLILVSCFLIFASWFLLLASWFLLPDSYFLVPDSYFLILASGSCFLSLVSLRKTVSLPNARCTEAYSIINNFNYNKLIIRILKLWYVIDTLMPKSN
jgi:hypothetical protein